jgi:hypothetical protein
MEHAPAEGGLQERQLVAGRYRLTARHREDETNEVWRAFDESAQHVVILAFLRDRQPASRDRFVAEARRIAMQPPTVMRVAAIHDDADGTFIVYEDLVPQSEVLDGFAPGAPSPELPHASLIGQGLTGLKTVINLRDPALIDKRLLVESASEFAAVARSRFAEVHLDEARLKTIATQARALLDRVVVEARALLEGIDPSGLGSVSERGSVVAQRLALLRLRARVPTLPRLSLPRLSLPRFSLPRFSLPAPRVRSPRVATPPAETVVRPARAPRAPRAPRLGRPVIHVRWGRVLFRGLSLGLIATFVATFPPDLATNLATDLKSEFDTRLEQVLQPAPPAAPQLARATFELPPLSAYGAAFEAQAAYPTAKPNGPVEWVVALRNTGSVGWYKGIDGAQASLALPDGTNAAVQSTPFVGPGQVGWFVVHVRASAVPGAYKLPLTPRIDGRGPLPDLGIFATVTVSTAP